MTLTGTHIKAALKAAGAGSGLVMPADQIATAFNDAMLTYGGGQFDTPAKVAALVSECMMESAYFRTTEEYAKNGRYAPYIGRTFIQLTWADNYTKFGAWCKGLGLVDSADYFTSTPKRLADLKWAALGGVFYFTQVKFSGHPLTYYAESSLQVGRAVNLGNPFSKSTPNGQKARDAAYKVVLALGAEIVPVVTPPPVTPPVTEPPVVVTPAPQEPTVKHSKTYDCDYVWHGKGNGYDGGWVPVNVAKILDAVAQELGRPIYLSQGGLSAYVLSGSTHKGLGAFDIGLRGLTKAQTWELASALLRSGIVMFPRGFVWDSFQGKTIADVHDGNEHGHCCSNENRANLHKQARDQIDEYLKGGDGLQGSAKYTGPNTPLGSWKTSPYNPANIKAVTDDKQAFYINVTAGSSLIGNTVDRVQKQTRSRGELIYAVKLIDRWGRWNAVTESGTFYALDYLSPTPLDTPPTQGVPA